MAEAVSGSTPPRPLSTEVSGPAPNFQQVFGSSLLSHDQAEALASEALKGLGLDPRQAHPVAALQRAIGAHPDGLFGPQTWTKAQAALKAKGGQAAADAIASLTRPGGSPAVSSPAPKPAGDQVAVQPAPGGTFDPVAAGLGGSKPTGHAAGPGATPATVNALAKYEGATWAGTLDGNGGRESSIIVPPDIDPTRPVEVIVFIPGIVGGDKNAANQALNGPSNFKDAINELGKKRNAIIVMPTLAYKHNEFKPPAEDIGTFQDAALARIQSQFKLKTGAMTLVAYSYGGQPLMNAAESGKIKPGTRLVSLDSTYTWDANLDIRKRLGAAVKAHGYDLHNFYNTSRTTRPVDDGCGTNHVLTGDHGALPRKLAAVLQEAYPVAP
jgi:hypothetical protein